MNDAQENENEVVGRDDSHQVAWRGLLTAHALLTKKIAKELPEAGKISYDDYDVLIALNESPGQRLRLSELAELTLLSHSGISRCVTRLEAAGMLKRERCETDLRGYFACLTRAGRQALLVAWPRYREIIERYFAARMTADEAEQLARLLHRVVSGLGPHRFHHIYPSRITDEPS